MADQAEMVKIRFCGRGPTDIETLWAVPISGDLYRLDNSPFFAYGVSWQDIVEAAPAEDNFLEFVRCIRKSGNRTLRVTFEACRTDDPPAQYVRKRIRDLDCSYEGMQPRMISVNIPPRVDLNMVADLINAQPGLEWEYADPTYDELHTGP